MQPAPQEKNKLTVVLRVEPGCLGPNGKDYVEDFCRFAQEKIQSLDSEFIHWDIVPRHDKTLPEVQYRVSNKTLSHEQAEKYLEVFDRDIDEFEGELQDRLATFIDQFLGC